MSRSVVAVTLRRLALGVCLACTVLGVPVARGDAQVRNGLIAFQSNRPSLSDNVYLNVFTMRPNGSQVTALLPQLDNSWDPAWSPDGQKIAFSSIGEENFQLFAADAGGNQIQQLSQNPDARDTSPAWSPGGGRIALISDISGNFDVYTMNADGSGPLDVSDNRANDCACFDPFGVFAQPTWSPDGTRIAFTSDLAAPGRNVDIYVMNRDGSDVRRVTRDAGVDAEPDWSPDSRAIAFQSDRDGDNEIFDMSPRGNYVEQITHNTSQDTQPDWSPDGNRIAFTSDRSGANDIWVMSADGHNASNLTHDAFFDERPDWQPIPPGTPPAARVHVEGWPYPYSRHALTPPFLTKP